MTLVLDEFLLSYASAETKRTYRGVITAFFSFSHCSAWKVSRFCKKRPSEMTATMASFLLSVRSIDPVHNRVSNPRTVNKKRAVLSSFCQFLIKRYGLSKNPVQELPVIRYKKQSTTQSLTKREVHRLMDCLKQESTKSLTHHRTYLLFVLLFRLALRRFEVAQLRWEDIDMKSALVSVIQKGGTQKVLPIPKDVLVSLRAYQVHSKAQNQESDFVFVAHGSNHRDDETKQKPLSTTSIYRIVRSNASRILPTKHITPHSLRKTFIELALSQNINLTALMNATGHESTQMIRYYDTQDALNHNAILMLR